jgi:gp16 family phage-associated protein
VSAVKLRSREQVREDFNKTGVSIADWAREHEFKYSQVVDVLRSDRQCRRGNSHKIAVLLGLKDGIINR